MGLTNTPGDSARPSTNREAAIPPASANEIPHPHLEVTDFMHPTGPAFSSTSMYAPGLNTILPNAHALLGNLLDRLENSSALIGLRAADSQAFAEVALHERAIKSPPTYFVYIHFACNEAARSAMRGLEIRPILQQILFGAGLKDAWNPFGGDPSGDKVFSRPLPLEKREPDQSDRTIFRGHQLQLSASGIVKFLNALATPSEVPV